MNIRVDCHTLLQGIFPTKGLNPHPLHLLHWQEGALPLASPGKPCGEKQRKSTKTESRWPSWNLVVFLFFVPQYVHMNGCFCHIQRVQTNTA